MIVRQFLQWVRTRRPVSGPKPHRALARAYLYSELSPDDLAAAEGAMIMLLDDPSPLVRRALSDDSRQARERRRSSCMRSPPISREIAAAGAGAFAAVRRCRSGRSGRDRRTGEQAAIARRGLLPRASPPPSPRSDRREACLTLLENSNADIAPFSIDRMVERSGHLAAIREKLLARDDLPVPTRQALLTKLSQTLAGFVAARQWLGAGHAETRRERPAKRRPSRLRPTRLTRKSAR